ncbi:MAG TPA: DUF4331 domain-containing protein [Streptosporangiaceae bacterium]|nr:DUF4331 domain-containing protein [Streptosporangiaceae bacterium]
MSSHREAPEISMDPVADSTDLYAFVSPDKPDTVTLIANYLPLQEPAGGPNFYQFGPDVMYEIHIDNDGDGQADITFQLRFTDELRDPDTFLYNTGPILSLNSTNWNRRQVYRVSQTINGRKTILGRGLTCPPCNIGPLSTPHYANLAKEAVHQLPGGIKVFAGQRAEGFYVDLGAIFDLGNLRPFEQLHNQYGMHVFSKPAPGVNDTNNLNVHSIAIQVPISLLGTSSSNPTIGVWTTASRQKTRIYDGRSNGESLDSGPWRQVSRLGNPLFNEVLVPLGQKDLWNSLPPSQDKQFASYVTQPGLAALLNDLYPGVFPNLAAFVKAGTARADLEAILLTGIPSGIISGFQNYTGSTLADMLRLNTSIPPSSKPNILGVLGGDLAGYPNGRRVFDDVVTIELRALAGLTIPLVDSSYTPDSAASAVTDGLTNTSVRSQYLDKFPYLGVPYDGFYTPS